MQHTVCQSHVCGGSIETNRSHHSLYFSRLKSTSLKSHVKHAPLASDMIHLGFDTGSIFFFSLQLYQVGLCQMLSYQVNNLAFH